jgi:hypothetical protein
MMLSREYILLTLAFLTLLSFGAASVPTAAPTITPGLCTAFNPGGIEYIVTNSSTNCYNCADVGCSWCDPNNGAAEYCFDPNTESCNGFSASGSADFVCNADGSAILALLLIILLAIFIPIIICGCFACVGGSVFFGSVWAVFFCFCKRKDPNAQPGFIGGNPQGQVSLYHTRILNPCTLSDKLSLQPYVCQSPMIPVGQVQYIVTAPGQQVPEQMHQMASTGKVMYANAQIPGDDQMKLSV